jgi:hypothetical protein
MDNLFKEVRHVQRRLALLHFLRLLGRCWFWSLLSAAIVAGAARVYPLGIVDWQWLTALLLTGLILAAVWTLFTMAPMLEAALEIDHRFGLQERISSALAMKPADRDTEVGQALLADAGARLRRVAVLEQFPLRPSRRILMPLFPAAVLVALLAFRPPLRETAAVAQTPAAPPLEVKRSAEDLRQKLAQRRQQAENEGLTDATELFKRLEEQTRAIQATPEREKALVKLNDLARELQDRRKQLGGEGLNRQMEKVAANRHGPADDLANAIARGDYQKAAQALKNLEEQLKDSKLDAAKKEELSRQIEQLTQKIEQMAREIANAQADLKKRADSGKLSDHSGAAGDLEDEIQKLEQQGTHMDALHDVLDKLGQSCREMKQGQDIEAGESMQAALQKIEDMARRQSELQALDGALEQLSDARRQMNCEQCGGLGCEKCQGHAVAEHEHGTPGHGIGNQPGAAVPPEPNIKASYFDSQVRPTVGKGAAQVTGLTGGPNLKNQAEAAIQAAADAIEHGSTDPLSGRRLPKKQSEQVREYFDSFRDGK